MRIWTNRSWNKYWRSTPGYSYGETSDRQLSVGQEGGEPGGVRARGWISGAAQGAHNGACRGYGTSDQIESSRARRGRVSDRNEVELRPHGQGRAASEVPGGQRR